VRGEKGEEIPQLKTVEGDGWIEVENGLVKVIVRKTGAGFERRFLAWDNGWHELAGPPERIKEKRGKGLYEDGLKRVFFSEAELADVSKEKARIVLKGEVRGERLEESIEVEADSPWIHIVVKDDTSDAEGLFEYALSIFAFKPRDSSYIKRGWLDFAWIPNLRPLDDQLVGDHVFRSPAVILRQGADAFALVPDLDIIRECRPLPLVLDLDLKSGVTSEALVAYGFADYQVVPHMYYRHDKTMVHTLPMGVLKYGFYLYLSAKAGEDFYKDVNAFLWQRWGRKFLEDIRPQVLPFAEYAKRAYIAARREGIWHEYEIEGTRCGGVADPTYWGRFGISHQPWICNLRTGYGMYWFGKMMGDGKLKAMGIMTKNLILAAPQRKEGPFLTRYKDGEWFGSLVVGDVYHTAAMSWTAYWMLRWYEDLEQDGRLLDKAKRYAEFLLKVQNEDGNIPSVFDKNTLEAQPVLYESAQTAISGLFLAELFGITRDKRYLEAAVKAADFIMQNVLPEMKYLDYETHDATGGKTLFVRGSLADMRRGPHTGIYPQNTLSIQWSADMFRRLYELTGENAYREAGERAIAHLCFYQQVWDISFRKAYLFGGFGVQITDAEYNDARQACFAGTLADYYPITGNPEYMERGIAALRASFALMNTPENWANNISHVTSAPLYCSPENCGHGADVNPDDFGAGGWTSFHWGSGGAAAGAAYVLNRFGGAYIDLERGRGFGIDGCRVGGLEIDGSKIRFELVSALKNLPHPYESSFRVRVKFGGLKYPKYEVTVNGQKNSYLKGELLEGIWVEVE